MKNLLKLFLLSAVFLVGSVIYTAVSFYRQNVSTIRIGLKLILLGIGFYLTFLPKTTLILQSSFNGRQLRPKDLLWLILVGIIWLFVIAGLLM